MASALSARLRKIEDALPPSSRMLVCHVPYSDDAAGKPSLSDCGAMKGLTIETSSFVCSRSPGPTARGWRRRNGPSPGEPRPRRGQVAARHRVGQCLATAHSLCRTFAPRCRRGLDTVTLINNYSEDRTAKYRDGPITQGSRIQVAVLLRQPDNEPRNSRTFYFVAADFKDFCRGRERVAHC